MSTTLATERGLRHYGAAGTKAKGTAPVLARGARPLILAYASSGMRHRLAALLCVAVAACSYDWTVGASAVDAGGSADGGVDGAAPGPDAAQNDANGEDVVAPDAMGDGAPVDCNALETKIQQDLPPALACTNGASNPCTTTVSNECGCTVVLGNGDLNAVTAYGDDVNEFTAAHCPRPVWCPSSCPTVQTGLCVVADATANTDACQQ